MERVVLVSGANGFVGRHVVNALAQRDEFGIIATDLQDRMLKPAPGGVVYKQADLTRLDMTMQLTADILLHAVVHLAGMLSKNDSAETHQSVFAANAGSTLNMLELARQHAAAFVFPSTGLVYGDCVGPFTEDMPPEPGDFYAASKLLGEQLVGLFARRYRLRSVVFRPSIIYGPGQGGNMFVPSLVRAILAGESFPMTKGQQKRDFVYVDDVASAIVRAVEKNDAAGIFNLASGKSVSIANAARLAESLTGISGCVRPGEVPYRDKEVWEYALDNTKAARELGWSPQVDFEEGLKRTIEWARMR